MLININNKSQYTNKQLPITRYFTRTTRTLNQTERIHINQDSIQNDNITTSTTKYNNKQTYVDDIVVPTSQNQRQ